MYRILTQQIQGAQMLQGAGRSLSFEQGTEDRNRA